CRKMLLRCHHRQSQFRELELQLRQKEAGAKRHTDAPVHLRQVFRPPQAFATRDISPEAPNTACAIPDPDVQSRLREILYDREAAPSPQPAFSAETPRSNTRPRPKKPVATPDRSAPRAPIPRCALRSSRRTSLMLRPASGRSSPRGRP